MSQQEIERLVGICGNACTIIRKPRRWRITNCFTSLCAIPAMRKRGSVRNGKGDWPIGARIGAMK